MSTSARWHGAFGWAGVQPRPAAWRLVHAFIGAVFGIFITGFVMHRWATGQAVSVPLLVAPMGASAVLLFGVPASPLAQPWAIIGGNTVSALCGIFWARSLGDPTLAAGLAVASAIVMMSLLRCLHPPGGAVALTAVIGGPAIAAAGWHFALMPVAINCLLLVAAGWLYNLATRGNYPHHVRAVADPATAPAAGYTMADVEAVLAQYDELLDVSSEDLDALFRQVEGRAYRRLHGVIRCEQIMRAAATTIAPDALLDVAARTLAAHGESLPVVRADGHVAGLLRADQLAVAAASAGQDATVASVMDAAPCLASPDRAIDELLPILSGGLHREAVVVDGQGRFLGLIAQTDLLAALWRGHIAEEIARHAG
ncbi:UNVERIFIED_ORG: CBS domain-containing membrane protein [Sphingomonas sp. R1F5B]